MGRYYRLLLDDYSAASFTSFDKEYFGTMEDMDGFFKALREDEDTVERFADLLSVYDKYLIRLERYFLLLAIFNLLFIFNGENFCKLGLLFASCQDYILYGALIYQT